MKKELKDKLNKYSSVTGAIALISSVANASVVYTDVDPDSTVTAIGIYALDLNNDLTTDFNINVGSSSYSSSSYIYRSKYIRINDVSNGAVARNGSYYADVINNSLLINSALTWGNYGLNLGRSYYYNGSSSTYSSVNGPWGGAVDKYVGLRFQIGGQQHYGWARLDVDSVYGQFTIKDYAYESLQGVGILAGDVGGPSVDSTFGLTLADNADNYNSSDFAMTFTAALDESNITEYRIVLVRNIDLPTFSLSNALGAPTSGYQSVTPSGANFSANLDPTLEDFKGNPIMLDSNYTAFVVSVPASGFGFNMSLGSNATFISSPPLTQPAQNVVISDIADNGDGSDMQVVFDKAQDETTLSEYKIIIVPKTAVSSFSLANADATPDIWRTTVAPTGSNITEILTTTTKDFQGNDIVENNPYHAFVLSIANNTINANILSDSSNELTLATVVNPPDGIEQLNASDINIYKGDKGIVIKNSSVIDNLKANLYSIDGRLLTSKLMSNQETVISIDNYQGVVIVELTADHEYLYSEKVLIGSK